jgi:hypothetical protein
MGYRRTAGLSKRSFAAKEPHVGLRLLESLDSTPVSPHLSTEGNFTTEAQRGEATTKSSLCLSSWSSFEAEWDRWDCFWCVRFVRPGWSTAGLFVVIPRHPRLNGFEYGDENDWCGLLCYQRRSVRTGASRKRARRNAEGRSVEEKTEFRNQKAELRTPNRERRTANEPRTRTYSATPCPPCEPFLPCMIVQKEPS